MAKETNTRHGKADEARRKERKNRRQLREGENVKEILERVEGYTRRAIERRRIKFKHTQISGSNSPKRDVQRGERSTAWQQASYH